VRASTRCTVGRDELQSATLPDHRSMDEEVESPSSVTMCCAIARSGVTKSNTRSKSSTPNRRSRRLPTDGHRLVGIKVNPSWRGEERQTACRVLVLCRAARHGSHSILSIRAMGGAVGRAAGDGAGTAQSPEQRQRERVESNRTACTCMLVSTLCRHGRSSSRVYARANRIRGASRENLHHRRNHTAILCLCTVQQSSRANQSGKMAFKRPFHAQSRTPVRSSDLRRLRDALASQFTALADQPDALKRLTADLQVCKATTHLDEPCTLYTAPNGDPRFFKLEDQAPPLLVPTCYATDLVPAGTLLPVLGTAEPVVQNLISGSALFAAGVSPSHLAHLAAQTSPPVRAGDLVGITVASDPTQRIVAVGYLAADPKEIQKLQEQDKGGRAVLTLHARGDFLWQSGSKVDAPLPEPQVRKADNGGGNDALADRLAATSLSRSPSSASSSAASTSAPAPAEPSRKQKKGKDKKERHGGKNGLVPVDAEEEEQPAADETRESVTAAAAAELTPAEIDTILINALLLAISTSPALQKPATFPLSASSLYSSYILHSRPASPPSHATVEIKKSSFKKLDRFVKQAVKKGYLAAKELKKGTGEWIVTSVEGRHPDAEKVPRYKTVAEAAAAAGGNDPSTASTSATTAAGETSTSSAGAAAATAGAGGAGAGGVQVRELWKLSGDGVKELFRSVPHER
jgi:predicted ribosome-associated RNA-binding protein Tma20